MKQEEYATPENCPLCAQKNHCGNLSSSEKNETCWCINSNITFPEGLLNQVSDAAKNKACICKTCALKYKRSCSQ